MKIADKIKTLRKEAGLSQAALAERVGLSLMTIRRYENDDRQPRYNDLRKIAEAIGVNTLELTHDGDPGIKSPLGAHADAHMFRDDLHTTDPIGVIYALDERGREEFLLALRRMESLTFMEDNVLQANLVTDIARIIYSMAAMIEYMQKTGLPDANLDYWRGSINERYRTCGEILAQFRDKVLNEANVRATHTETTTKIPRKED